MKRLTVLFGFLVIMGVQGLLAQSRQITGTVTSADDGLGIPGVSVVVKGTTIGTTTDINGKYSISVAQGSDVLVFSFVGMRTAEVPISGSRVDVVLESESKVIDEVMVVAYGTMKRESFTGSAATIKAEQLERMPVSSIDQAMLGVTPGIQMGATSGQPGSLVQIRIRGNGSISSSNEPLYVVDGVPVTSGKISELTSTDNNLMSTLNPNDIESITVLKDAAAASLYGSRAANGVILITTKKGKEGKTRFKLKSEFGFNDFALQSFELATPKQAYELKREGFFNFAYYHQGQSISDANAYADNQMAIKFPLYNPSLSNSRYDWEDALFRKGEHKNVELSASGGNEKTQFYASFGYLDQLGHSVGSDFERYTGRVNLNHKANERISVGFNSSFTQSEQNMVVEGRGGSYMYANSFFATRFYLSQLTPVKTDDGNYNTNIANGMFANLVYDIKLNDQRSKIFRSTNKAFADFKIVDGLNFRTTFGYDAVLTNEDRYWSPLSSDGETHNGYGHKRHRIFNTLTSSNILSYAKTLAEVHNIDTKLGYEIEGVYDESTSAEGHDYPNAILPSLNNAATPYTAANGFSQKRMISYLSNVNYNFDNKYYASFSFRRDGSSQLGINTRWGNFWSVSAAWRISQEGFLKEIEWLNDWKIRGSYGTNGNLPTDWYAHMALYEYGYNYNSSPGSRITQVFNPNLEWEKNNSLNIGTDFKLFDFLTIELEYYKRRTTDLLLEVPVSLVSGFETTWQNVGEMENKGFELSINSVNISKKDFLWTSNLNFSHNQNEILKLYNGEPILDGIFRLMEGYSFNTLYNKEWAGVDPQDGRGMWYLHDAEGKRRKNDDGTFMTTKINGQATRTILGSSDPKLVGGFSNNISYKGIDLSFVFAFKLGGKIWVSPQYFYQDDGMNWYSPVTKDSYENRWKGPGDNSNNPMYIASNPYFSNYSSSRRMHDASYLRLKSVSLGYTIPSTLTKRVGVESLRISASAFNLMTFSKNDLIDPEVSARGEYTSGMPPMKTVTFGLELNF